MVKHNLHQISTATHAKRKRTSPEYTTIQPFAITRHTCAEFQLRFEEMPNDSFIRRADGRHRHANKRRRRRQRRTHARDYDEHSTCTHYSRLWWWWLFDAGALMRRQVAGMSVTPATAAVADSAGLHTHTHTHTSPRVVVHIALPCVA